MPPRYTRNRTNSKNRISIHDLRRLRFPIILAWIRSNKSLIAKIIGVCALVGVVTIAGAFMILGGSLPDPNSKESNRAPISTKIYDRTGEHLLFEIFKDERRTPIKLSDLPEYVRWATLVLEDKNFYSHPGFDLKGITRALVVDILHGGLSQGGSTITQQYIKNALLTRDKSPIRKMKELVYAYKIEKRYSKDQILELYFNQIPYGGSAYGIEAAAQTFFGKHAIDLSVSEAAILAALPQSPSYYSPYGSHKEALLGRAQYTLDQMKQEGYISEQTHKDADLSKVEFKPLTNSIQAPHFVMYVRELIAQKYGDLTLQEDGLRVITTLDYDKQMIAEQVVKEGAERNAKNSKASNAALLTMNPKTGEILTMVGSKDYFDKTIDGNVNVTLRPRQPGSSFKPIAYAAAFQKGYSPETILFDLDTKFPAFQGPYEPKNYDGKTRGPISLRNSLAGSLNIPSVKLLYLAGINPVLDLADSLGYTTLKDRSRFGLSLVLGGGEVKLIEHVRAFSAFARDGMLPGEPQAILKITDKEGRTLEEYKPKTATKILEPNVVRQINSILSDTEARKFVFGATPYLTITGRPVAVKTGTTNDYRDAWTIGYTPSIVTGVWVGNNDNSEMIKGGAAAMVAAPIWDAFMEAALKGTPVETFKAPEPPQLPTKPMLNGNYVWSRVDEQQGYQEVKEVHEILYYVDIDNPLGPAPKNPTKDPQFEAWEAPVREWAAKNGFASSNSPSYSQPQTNQKLFIKITNPQNNQEIASQEFTVSVLAVAQSSAIDRVEYFIDNQKIGETKNSPYSLQTLFPDLPKTKHTLKATVIDRDGNAVSDSIQVSNETMIKSQFIWVSPTQGQTISNFPFPLILQTTADTKKVDYYSNLNGQSQWIGFQTEFPNSKSTFQWSNPPKSNGTYSIYGIITKSDGSLIKTQEISVTIQNQE